MAIKATKTVGRNNLCPCGSELKAKFCHQDHEKMKQCNRIANVYMSQLIMAERKKRGLDPYLYTCKGCGKGTDKPLIAEIAAPTPIQKCPFCGGTDLVILKGDEAKCAVPDFRANVGCDKCTRKNCEAAGKPKEPEKKSSIILEN